MTSVHDCCIVGLGRIQNPQGNITVVEKGNQVHFDVRRVYYLYDAPGGESRGGHALRALAQLMVAVMGAFDIVLDDGKEKKTVSLNRAYQGLLIVPMIWREVVNFSSGGVCLVLASAAYDESDYIRDYELFRRDKHAYPLS
jgi:hypothetical protein